MLNAKKLIDNAILNLETGDKMEMRCSVKEANSLRVRLHREIKKLRDFNATLADSLWVSRSVVEKDVVILTLGKSSEEEALNMVVIKKADGTSVPYNNVLKSEGEDEFDEKRMRELMEKDNLDKDTIEAVLGKET